MTSLSSSLGVARAHLQKAAATAESALAGFESLKGLGSKGEGSMERVRSAANSAYRDTEEIDSSSYGRAAKAGLADASRTAGGTEGVLDQTSDNGEQAEDALQQALLAVDSADGDVAFLKGKINLAMGNQSSALNSTRLVSSALSRAESGIGQAEFYAGQVASDSDGRDVSSAADSLGNNAVTASLGFSDVSTQAGYGSTFQAYASHDIALALHEIDRLVPPTRSLAMLTEPTSIAVRSLLTLPEPGPESWNQLS